MNKLTFISIFTCAMVLICSGLEQAQAVTKDRAYFESRGEVVWEVPTEQKVICLTFDDGPDPIYTVQILDLLAEFEAKATFFVAGKQVEKYPMVALRQILENHELANHTFTHPNLSQLSNAKLKNEIHKTEEAILSVVGIQPKLFRPPGGYYNEKIIQAVNQSGYTMVMWSWHQDTRDWAQPGVQKIVRKVLSNARNGDIVLFHDFGGDRSETILALKHILPELQRRGYQFITVSQLLEMKETDTLN